MATASSVNLEDVPSMDLMTELLRRMKCSTKPDKRLILIGDFLFFVFLVIWLTFEIYAMFVSVFVLFFFC